MYRCFPVSTRRSTRRVLAALIWTLLSPLSAFASPEIERPSTGDVLPMTAAGLVNPPYELVFEPEPGADFYRVTFDDGAATVTVDVTDFAVGEVCVTNLQLPPATQPGTYKVFVQGVAAGGTLVGSRSAPVQVDLVQATPTTFAPSVNTTLISGGTFLVDSVSIPAGVEVKTFADLTFYSLGPVTIDGDLWGSFDGASLRILANDTVEVRGRVFAAAGLHGVGATVIGTDPTVVTEAVGADAGRGGDLVLMTHGADLAVLGGPHLTRIGAGHGGSAQSVRAEGADADQAGQEGGRARAIGGDGGDGGDLTLFAVGGSLQVDVSQNLILASNGGLGAWVFATGGDGGRAPSGGAPGVGGSVETYSGSGGNAGRLTLDTFDFDGDGSVSLAEWRVVIGGAGYPAGPSTPIPGVHGQSPLPVPASCALTPAATPGTMIDMPGRAGDGWASPATAAFASAYGIPGWGSGRGGDAIAIGGDAGHLRSVGLPPGETIDLGSQVTWSTRGGPAWAYAGDGGPNGGSGGTAQAFGGPAGDGVVSDGRVLVDATGGRAVAEGGEGREPASCCGSNPLPGLPGGSGGDASAIGGAGGATALVGGDGGRAVANGGFAGQGGEGCSPGAGGLGGGARALGGAGGPGGQQNGAPGTTFVQAQPDGASGVACCP